MRYYFSTWVLDVSQAVLRGAAGEVELRPQAFRLLQLLIEHSPQVLSKDELIDGVWGTEHISVNSLPQAISEIRHALGDGTRQPTYIKTLHRRGYRFICPVRRDEVPPTSSNAQDTRPDEVPPTSSEAQGSRPDEVPPTSSEAQDSRPDEVPPTSRTPHRWLSVALLVLCLGLWAMFRPNAFDGGDAAVDGHGASSSHRGVAVLPFRQISDDTADAWLSTGLAEALAAELRMSEDIRVVSGDAVGRLQMELELATSEGFGPAVLQRIRHHLDADLLVTGTYQVSAAEGRLRFAVRVQDLVGGRHVAQLDGDSLLRRQTNAKAWREMAAGMGARLRRLLELPVPDALQEGFVPLQLPAARQALPDYYLALRALYRQDPQVAIGHLERAAAVDPDSALVQFRLAEAAVGAGRSSQAQQASQRARQLADGLPLEDRLRIEALFQILHGAADEALLTYGRLQTLHPDDSTYFRHATELLIQTGQGRKALENLDGFRRGDLNPLLTLRLELLEARAAQSLSDLQRLDSAANRAIRRSHDLGVQLLAAQGQVLAGDAARQQGDLARAAALFEEAYLVFSRRHQQRQAAETLDLLGEVLFRQGDLEEADQRIAEGLRLSREIGDQRTTARLLIRSANLRHYGGQPAEARDLLQEAQQLSATYGNHTLTAEALLELADLDQRQGELSTARDGLIRAREIAQMHGERRLEASAWNRLGSLHGSSGSFDEAEVALKRALELFREIGDRQQTAQTLANLANVHSARGNLAIAGQLYSEALEYQRLSGSRRGVAKVLYNLGLVYLRLGRVAEARDSLQESFTAFSETGELLNACFVERKLGDVMRHQADLATAERTLNHALATSRETGHRSAEAHALHSLGELAWTRGDLPEANAQWQQALALRQELEQGGNAAVTQLSLARLALAEGRSNDAETTIRQSLPVLRQNSPGWHAWGLIVLARVHLDQQAAQQAFSTLQEARQLLVEEENLMLRMQVRLDEVRARKQLDAAGTDIELEELIEQAQASGFISLAEAGRRLRS